MKKNPRLKWSFLLFCLLLIQLTAIFLLPFTVLTAAIVIIIDLLLWIYTIALRNRIEKIQYASSKAQEAMDYVSVDMPVGIIAWDESQNFTWMNPAITEKVQHLSQADQQDMVNELLQRAEKVKSIYKIDDILYHFELDK